MHLPVGELKVPPDPVSSFKAACASRQHINSPAEAERAQQPRKQDIAAAFVHQTLLTSLNRSKLQVFLLFSRCQHTCS